MSGPKLRSLSGWVSRVCLDPKPDHHSAPAPVTRRFPALLVFILSAALAGCGYRDQVYLPPYAAAGPSGPRLVWVHVISRDALGLFVDSKREVLPNGHDGNFLAAWMRWISLSQDKRVSNLRSVSRLMANGNPHCYIIAIRPLVVGFASQRQRPGKAQIAWRRIGFNRNFNGVQAVYSYRLMLSRLVLLRDWPPQKLLQQYRWILNPSSKSSRAATHAIKSFVADHRVIIDLPGPTSARSVMIQQPWKKMGLKFHYP